MSCYLGIDAGTSGIKAIVLNEKGETIGTGLSEVNIISPKPNYVEEDPIGWWNACDEAVKIAVSKSKRGSDIAGVGFSGQMQGCTLMDKDMLPIGNSLIWLDLRASSYAEKLNERITDKIFNITASYCLPSFWAPKLLWLRDNKKDDFDRIHTVLFPKDYIRFRMTGEVSTEVSDAALSWLMDMNTRDWSDEMFKFTGLPKSIVPKKILESCDIAGYLLKDVADSWGVKAGIPIAAGGGDQPAGGIGVGIVRTGSIAATIGTSGVVFGVSDTPFKDIKKHGMYSLCHCAKGKYAFLGCTLGAGGSMKWVRDTFYQNEKEKFKGTDVDIYDYMTSEAAKAPIGSEGLVFLPYMSGEGTPHMDPDARGTFFGLSYRHNLGSITRAVMEGVTFSLRDTLEIIRKTNNIKVDEVRAMGGGSKSALWRQIQADVYNATVVTTNMQEGGAAGAAIMGAVASGCYKTVDEACADLIRIVSKTEPIEKNVAIYDEYYKTYVALYPALKDLYKVQAKRVDKILNN